MSYFTKDYSYPLDKSLIAQEPKERDSSRLFIPSFKKHTYITELDKYLPKDTLIVFNNSLVMPSKLPIKKKSGGIGELFLIEKIDHSLWKCFLKISRKPTFPFSVFVQDYEIIIESQDESFFFAHIPSECLDLLEIPLPPYIKRPVNSLDSYFYQTSFASIKGSLAAPTAGLHFSSDYINHLKNNFETMFITLHVGLGTFLPVKTENILDHTMHEETYYIHKKQGYLLNNHKGPILCIGTTSLRAVESFFENQIDDSWQKTSIFFHPYHRPKKVKMLLTNFHLPETTLFMLVCSFVGKQEAFDIYQEAMEHKYSFFSYGDTSLLFFKDHVNV